MSITSEQVADLQRGDVVELREAHWPIGSVARGPVYEGEKGLFVAGLFIAHRDGSGPIDERDGSSLTVVSRAPRPLYVNHPRTEPVLGDVVRDADGNDGVTWVRADTDQRPWISPALEIWGGEKELPARLRLLVDGETGQVVP